MAWGWRQARPRQTSVWQPQGLQRWRAAAPLGRTSRSKTGGGKNPRGASGELNPLSWARPGFVRMLQSRGEMLPCSSLAPSSKACSHPPRPSPAATSPGPSLPPCLPNPATPAGTAPEGSHPSLKPGHALQEPLPLDGFCQCIAPPQHPSRTYTGHIVLPNTPLPPHISPMLRWC